ncbi:PDT-domain-containing protein [Sodiomyces alkalinus F11]|uniref:prephenate dehydratase n=1 Tax=Sodiomyces alkalinus (strain CBS 110278 / VKM F-3762 / F11) TaxID=1314773 RepID=A0A3N2PN95_SODAK|nr:PDT-domain-containing protein [Sodiomyces alkalinus F11]ROT35900.1 PDT-domain-containing protein [Sodiomyces alkalinus F11]
MTTGAQEEVKRRPLVGFLGPKASYSHQATLQSFPEYEWDLTPLVTIPDIFAAVQAGDVAYGVVPFENSTNGSVVFSLDCFADRNRLYPDIAVCAEIYLDVHHYLVGRLPPSSVSCPASTAIPTTGGVPFSPAEDNAGSGTRTPTESEPHPPTPRAHPRADLSHIRRLYSHPQAWGQCTAFLSTYLKGVEAVDVSSTSRAAELVAADPTGTSAAVSSAVAAQLHGIDVLAECIEDRPDNTTRFFVVRKESISPSAERAGVDGRNGAAPQRDVSAELGHPLSTTGGGKGAKTKSLVSFTVPHEAPGALADVLGCFRRFELNLTSINSRPSLVKPFQYVFFVEFQGHKFRDPEERVKGVLEAVGEVAETWRWLGSWDDQRAVSLS